MSQAARDVVLELRGVSLALGGEELLRDIDLVVYEEELLGLVFTSGRGKSSLLKIAAGLLAPTAGEVRYRGRRIEPELLDTDLERAPRLGFVFQDGGLLINMTIYDNVALPLRYHTSLREEKIEKVVMGALEEVGMAGLARALPFQISQERQRLVALARALVRRPELVLVDNFFQGADAEAWQHMVRLFRTNRDKRGIAFVLVMEADPNTYGAVDRLCVIERGRVLATNTVDNIRTHADHRVSRIFRAMEGQA